MLGVWGAAESNPWLSTILDAVMGHLGAPPPEPGTPGPFSLGDSAGLRRMIEGAGLGEVDVAEIETEQPYESQQGWWEHLREVSGPLAAVLDALPEADHAAIRGAALSAAEQFTKGDGSVVFPATALGAAARKPA